MSENKGLVSVIRLVVGSVILLVCGLSLAHGAARERISLDSDWLFQPGNQENASLPVFEDSGWRQLDLPHDWSIEGDYDKDNPAGVAGGFLPTGMGWYRKHIQWLPEWENRKVLLTFDGVYMNSEIWVNGTKVGGRPYGYIGFSFDISEQLKDDKNTIAVKVDNSKVPSGRWYTGSGIYRHVWLTTMSQVHIAEDGVFVRSSDVSKKRAVLKVSTEINGADAAGKVVIVRTELRDAYNHLVKSVEAEAVLSGDKNQVVDQKLEVLDPQLWSPGSPYLYKVRSQLVDGENLLDRVDTVTGFRRIDISAERGFELNGKQTILQGISMHHDAGPVGAAVPEDVLRRRMQLLKAMGVNAIRTTHNPFAPEFYRMADEMGFLVMNEAFDGWWEAKAKFDYGLYFDTWWKHDLRAFVRRDRNHPSVVMWSVGNEVPGYTPDQQKQLVEFIEALDDTRPVTQGRGYAGGHLTIAGFNGHGEYKGAIEAFHKKNPDTPVIGTEMTHTTHARGIFRSKTQYRVRDYPAPWETRKPGQPEETWQRIKKKVYKVEDLTDTEVWPENPLVYGSDFDNSMVRMPIREEIRLARKLPYLLGTFRWTAFDYLGESFGWPARTHGFGVIDLAGFPKGVYHLYRSQWTRAPMVHMDPHWTHPGKEGVEIPVVVYTNQPVAELFLNGRSLGKKTMGKQMQLVWKVPYSPGELKVVASKSGKEIRSMTYQSAGKPVAIRITRDRALLRSGSADVAHLTLEVVDAEGVPVPDAANRLSFEVSGPGELIGLENGDILDLDPHKISNRKLFSGKLLALIQAKGDSGEIRVSVNGQGLEPASVSLQVR
ncbi:MAG: DUF4982 domain-containing protein [Gammaproteobacteria bacterium]|nr:DUF4982 domain-containing protein [Gammaproteobacteria bacterium]